MSRTKKPSSEASTPGSGRVANPAAHKAASTGQDPLDYRKLRELPTVDALFGKELTSGMAVFNRGRKKVPGARPFGSELPVDPAVLEIIEQWWPEIFDSTQGGCVTVEPEAGKRLEKLCEMFGVPLKLKTHSTAVFGHAYDIFVQAFGWHVKDELSKPGYIRKIKTAWEPDWIAYLEAVAYQRTDEVRRLARKLRVLRSDANYPDRLVKLHADSASQEIDAALDTLWALEDARSKPRP